ncbi:hypothetical protein PHYC_02834 [Phycisphaerales bacterium]|nr:hypothetical protein PHYC_02834 [Phycisphaerales bacterium]
MDGKVVLDGSDLPEGTRVLITPDPVPFPGNAIEPRSDDPIYRLGDDAVDGGIPNLSAGYDSPRRDRRTET